MHPRPDPIALRRLALAVAVLHDVDLEPCDEGLILRGGPPVEVAWAELREAAGCSSLDGPLARLRALRHLVACRFLADRDPADLVTRARPVGFPVDAGYHPGHGWAAEQVLGGALDLGIGFVGVGADPDGVVAVPGSCMHRLAVDPAAWWPAARDYLERMGGLAARRLTRDPGAPLRPMGDCDVVTLLGSAALRRALCSREQSGMVAAAVPMRRRGWTDLARIDPAFAVAAAAATDVLDRGFPRPVLVTADEVVVVPAGGRPAELALRDHAV